MDGMLEFLGKKKKKKGNETRVVESQYLLLNQFTLSIRKTTFLFDFFPAYYQFS